jgi:glycosyltransferase involved in cell wall biosynthesis
LRNLAVSKSSGKYITFIDSDDLWHPERLAMCMRACTDIGCEVCITDCIEFDGIVFKERSRGHRLNNSGDFSLGHEILINNVALSGTVIFFGRNVYDRLNGFDESMRFGEHDFVCRALYQFKSVYVPSVLVYVRRHGSNITWNENNEDITSLLEYNVTLGRIYDTGGISKKDLRKTMARNLYLMAQHVLPGRGLSVSLKYFMTAVRFDPRLRKIVGQCLRMLRYLAVRPGIKSKNV